VRNDDAALIAPVAAAHGAPPGNATDLPHKPEQESLF
jgi:hypothetical protein